ncbi:hypothetical protein B0H13DRAFT_967858 [Mycena leptocephala]|nr:hypothetical protein B0H13DRAFT_967858 [Mycena leptocephala]
MAVILIPGTKESYIGTFLETIIYGVYLSVFFECCGLFWKRRTHSAKQIYVMATAALMFIVITMRCIVDIIRIVVPLDNFDETFGPLSGTTATTANACWLIVTIVADVFIIFRAFIVWNRNWLVIVFPSILCLANFGVGAWLVILLVRLGDQLIWNTAIIQVLGTFIAITMATNVICTGLIAFRILRVHHQLAWMGATTPGRSYSMKILSTIVESAVIYTLLLIGLLITGRFNSYIGYLIANCASPTIGLVFSYIIIRVSRGTAYGENTEIATATTSISWHRRNNPTRATFELSQSHSMPAGTRSEVQITLERERIREHNEASKDRESNGAKHGNTLV